jgi:ATP diphosphatase
MAALRTPGSGCPWDLAQSFSTIAPYTIEEAYEVADAITRGDLDDLRDELGDLLLQVVFHARMAEEAGAFDFSDVVSAICEKLLRRHPHVFGDAGKLSSEEVSGLWQRIKAQEKADRAARRPDAQSRCETLAGVPVGLPALTRALKLQAKAAEVGFDWDDSGAVVSKITEEAAELASAASDSPERLAEELGDLMFAVVNLARHYKQDPETALRLANAKFEGRFAFIERALAQRGKTPAQSSLEEMDTLWNEAKELEKSG